MKELPVTEESREKGAYLAVGGTRSTEHTDSPPRVVRRGSWRGLCRPARPDFSHGAGAGIARQAFAVLPPCFMRWRATSASTASRSSASNSRRAADILGQRPPLVELQA